MVIHLLFFIYFKFQKPQSNVISSYIMFQYYLNLAYPPLAKAEYLSSKIEEHKNDSKKLWQQLKTLGYSNKTEGETKVLLDIDGEICFDSNRVANYINEFYTSIALSLVNKLSSTENIFSTESDVFKEHCKSRNVCMNTFKLSPVTIDFVYKELIRLKSNKSNFLYTKSIVTGESLKVWTRWHTSKILKVWTRWHTSKSFKRWCCSN